MGPNTRFIRLYGERDPEIAQNPDDVDTLIFCSGKIYYELVERRKQLGLKNIAICTVEQIAPFPFDLVTQIFEQFNKVAWNRKLEPGSIVWCQEEPKNMGAWSYVQPRFMTVAR